MSEHINDRTHLWRNTLWQNMYFVMNVFWYDRIDICQNTHLWQNNYDRIMTNTFMTNTFMTNTFMTNTFMTEHIYDRTHSWQNTFMTEHIFHRTKRIDKLYLYFMKLFWKNSHTNTWLHCFYLMYIMFLFFQSIPTHQRRFTVPRRSPTSER